MNYSIVSFLEKRLSKELSVFEYGSGYSTVFYSRLAGEVTSIEYDKEWFDIISGRVGANVEVRFAASDVDGAYCRSINVDMKKYDVVIVDGRDRINCMKRAFGALSESGVVLLDDSDRPRYQAAFQIAAENGFRSLDFEGLKPTGATVDRSTLFYRPNNCLNI
ncbi:MAG: FkbM family methyltransferase [Pyrinomonadaceae bacterium]